MQPPSRPLNRRAFVRKLALGAGTVFGHNLAIGVAGASPAPARSEAGVVAQRNVDALAVHAGNKGLIYGAAVVPDVNTAAGDADYAGCYAAEAGLLGSGNDYKWDHIHPLQDRFNFGPGDALAAMAQANGQLLRGHTLVWHNQVPAWVQATLSSDNGAQILADHISSVVGHYAGMMHSWDVVNEVVNVPDGRPDGLRKTLWLDALGPGYIALAFQTAAAADPLALLTYNDYGLEYNDGASQRKRAAALNLLQGLIGRGVPVQALGVQGHLNAGRTDFDANGFVSFLNDVSALGLKIFVTELDASDKSLPADITQRDAGVAIAYRDFLAAALSVPATSLIMTWGISDRQTWLSTQSPRPDGLPVRPLPMDANLARKPAWTEMAHAFDNAPGPA